MLVSGQKLKELYEFGPFRVDPEKEILLRGNESIPLQPKTFQILLVLLRHQQQVVTKDELMKSVWPDTFVEEANLSRNIFMLRKALGESPQDHQYILTVPGRGYRLAQEVRLVTEQQTSIAPQTLVAPSQVKATKPWVWMVATAAVLVIAGVAAAWLLRKPAPAERVTLVLADFENSTGDAVFDGTLRQGLSVELDQSPFLSLITEDRIRQTLVLMHANPEQRLTPATGREVCQRTGSAATLDGSIAILGSQYILGLRAVSCRTGDVLAEEQETADSKEKVLAALDRIAVKVREKLGESLGTVQRYGTPLEEATTPSLEALQSYTLGRQMMVGRDRFSDAVPFFQRAILLDPEFAMASAALGSCYQSLGETELAEQNVRRAYEQRTRVSQPEKFYIESTYYHYATGDLEKARQVYELAAQIYPRYSGTHLRLWLLYSGLGDYQKALAEIQEAIRLDPARVVNSVDLVANYIDLGRLKEARDAVNAMTAQLNSPDLRLKLYLLDFLQGDAKGMQDQVRWASDKPTAEGMFLDLESESAAYAGRLKQSRELSRQAMESATHAQQKQLAALFEANQSLWESLVGNKLEAEQDANSALGLSKGKDMLCQAALSLAFSGENARAEAILQELTKRFPDDTILQFDLLPTIRARIALGHNAPSQAISLLQPAARYELGTSGWSRLGLIYTRGEAFLAAHRWTEAAGEFQKIIDHRGIVANQPFGALAHLQLARAYSAAGDNARAKRCYEDFLSLWKDADADIPLLKQAKTEYIKLS